MTWVIGASSMFGYGAMMSDIRVTFSDGSQRDLVQKAYGLGPFIVGGFAGSVKIGFDMLVSLQQMLCVPETATEPGAWEPIEVANHWKAIATGIFSAAHPSEQAGQSHIMLVGISHEADPATVHMPNVVQGPRAIIIRMRSPNFELEITSRRLSVEHIGSGAGVVRYTELMQSYFDIGSDTLKAETAAFGMWPRMLGHGVMRVVEDNPIDGISPHVHILVCRSGDIIAMANDSRKFPQDGSGPIEFKMPPVARSYSEFLAMCQADGIGAQGAVA